MNDMNLLAIGDSYIVYIAGFNQPIQITLVEMGVVLGEKWMKYKTGGGETMFVPLKNIMALQEVSAPSIIRPVNDSRN